MATRKIFNFSKTCCSYTIVRRQRQQQPYNRFYSYYYDTRFNDRMAMLKQQQIDIQKTIMSEQLLGLYNNIKLQSSDVNNTNRKKQYISNYTMKELRIAYFQAAKQCHPDSHHKYNIPNPSSSSEPLLVSSLDDDDTPEEKFIRVTNAYEYLREQILKNQNENNNHSANDDDDEICNDDNNITIVVEEQRYRDACMEVLGQPAEIIEESKRCPIFRQWLFGRTDAAYYWQSFFMLHGGLAPQLRPKKHTTTKLLLNSNDTNQVCTKHQSTDEETPNAISTQQRPRRRRPQQR